MSLSPETIQSLFFNLSNALSRDPQLIADLLQRVFWMIIDTEPHADDLPAAIIQACQQALHNFAILPHLLRLIRIRFKPAGHFPALLYDRFGFMNRMEIEKTQILLFMPFPQTVQMFGTFRLMRCMLFPVTKPAIIQVLMCGDAHVEAMIIEESLHTLPYPVPGIGGESNILSHIEPVDGSMQAKNAFLKYISQQMGRQMKMLNDTERQASMLHP